MPKDKSSDTGGTPRSLEGKLDASGFSFAVIASRFNHFVVDRLVEGALDALARHGADMGRVTLVRVPGSFEIPVVAKRVAGSRKHDAVICLGAVIRGGTPHFDFIAAEVTKGIAQASMETGVPIIYGVITPDTLEQAIERAGTKAGNKGFEAAVSAIEMADLFRNLG
ncbi:MAG: 6,7-dimethyl-8-ribityllumazine synthase [Deltaproteobacteria bacterium]|nr:6,7-dimethyl-8-ribityllumazine synthase [Deltaproteobacteria bacterium]